MTAHVAYCDGRKVATVLRSRHGKGWTICWHSRQNSMERIASPDAAKSWIAQILHGKQVEWKAEEAL